MTSPAATAPWRPTDLRPHLAVRAADGRVRMDRRLRPTGVWRLPPVEPAPLTPDPVVAVGFVGWGVPL